MKSLISKILCCKSSLWHGGVHPNGYFISLHYVDQGHQIMAVDK